MKGRSARVEVVRETLNEHRVFSEFDLAAFAFDLDCRGASSNIPVIDFNEAKNGDRTNTIQKIIKAAEEFGCFQLTCGIVLKRTYPRARVESTACGHPYCYSCRAGYFSTSINDGPGCFGLRCPDPTCGAAVGQDMINLFLKAKIAKLRTQLLEPPKGSSGGGEGFEVTKFGHGRVALIGFPSVWKSTLLTMLTGTHSEAASYEFTTLASILGIIHYNDTKIQLLDLPGII